MRSSRRRRDNTRYVSITNASQVSEMLATQAEQERHYTPTTVITRTPITEEATQYPPPQDVSILLDNPNICRRSASQLQYIVYVHSSPQNAERRLLLRSTWLNASLYGGPNAMAKVFLLGRSGLKSVNEQVKVEAKTYGDILQGDFVDTYRNLTLKALMGLKWLSVHCPGVKFALKADDDTFVNIFRMLDELKAHDRQKKLILCPLWADNAMPILRDPTSCRKWCVKNDEFPGRSSYPRYCAGLAFVLTGDLIPMLHNYSRITPFFWIDDVYVTGLLPIKVAGIRYVNLVKKVGYYKERFTDDWINRRKSFTSLFIHIKKPDTYLRLWKWLLQFNNNITLPATDLLI